MGWRVSYSILNKVIREALTKKVTIKQNETGKGTSPEMMRVGVKGERRLTLQEAGSMRKSNF